MNTVNFGPERPAPPEDESRAITLEEWISEAKRRFGEQAFDWQFQCPGCGNVARVRDFQQYADQGATPDSASCECIGRYRKPSRSWAFGGKPDRPCDYAGYGLLRISPVTVKMPDGKLRHSFAFAPADESPA